MGKRPERPGKDMKLTFMVPWSKSKVTQTEQHKKSISLKPPIWQEIKRARRMFKSMDCDNLRETSQKMIVDTFAPVAGGGASIDRGRGQQVDTSF